VGQTGFYSSPSTGYGQPAKAHARRSTYTDKQKKSWPSVRLSSGPPLPHSAGHKSGSPPLSSRTRHTARSQWRRGCGLISADAGAHGLDFSGAPSVGGSYFFFAPLLPNCSEQTVVQGSVRSNGGSSGSPIWPATARPARTVGRGPVVVLQEGALRR
jgi:hypothetical protein